MKSKIVPVKNIARLSEAAHALTNRSYGMPGMGLVHGETGLGKTTATTWLINRIDGVYIRAMAAWTPSAMLGALCKELHLAPRGQCAAMVSDIVEKLSLENRPIFVDEADYLVDSKRMTETLRDLHDMATVPVVLIGMAGIDQRLSHRKQLTGRILREVKFEPCDMEDARTLSDQLCEVKVRDDLLDRAHKASRGEVRRLVVSLARIEAAAKARGLAEFGSTDWGRRDDFFTGESAVVAPAGKVTTLTPGVR